MDYSGYGQSSWDGSLVSLNSSTYSVRPSSPSSAHDSSPDPTSVPLAPRPLVPSPSTAHSLSNSSASLHPASPASAPPSPPHTTASAPPPIPSLPPSRPGPLPTDAPHPLASFLLASLSPPTSPTSLASFPASRSESIEPGSPHSRGRSSTGGSGRGREGELVMPSMRLGNAGRGERREGARVVLAGKTVEERRGLARLLGEEGDMTGSFASARLSERSTVSGGQEAMFEELKYATRTMAFYHPANGVEVDALAAALLVSLEKMEAILDSTYPTTQTLANLVTEATRDDFEACFFLFSSPPTQSEVVAARMISQLLPLFPVLLLPPPPTSKPQKTAALVHAVSQQLTSAGVRWTSAFGTLEDGKRSPIYVLPSEVFAHRDGGESSGTSSLASSLELPPQSLSFSARSASPAPPSGDLGRLRSLVRTSSAREQIRRNKTIAFLEWREIEVAARGGMLLEINNLPSDWAEKAYEEGEKKAQLHLDFSRRVAERRTMLAARRVEEAGSQEARSEAGDDDGHLGPSTSTSSLSDLLLSRSSLTDPTTPRCSHRPFSIPPSSQSSVNSNLEEMDLTGSYFASSPPSYVYSTKPELVVGSDPFHLPSLLSLVGVNIRLALLPPPATGQAEKHRRGVAGWVGTAALLSAVFLAGMLRMDGSYIIPALQRRPSSSSAVSTGSTLSPVPSSSRLSPSPPLTPTPADLVPKKSRRDQVLEAVDKEDIGELRRLACGPGGFESSELRRAAWPVLLGTRRLEKSRAVEEEDSAPSSPVPPPPVHKDEGQVMLDVNRSFVSYPVDITASEKESLRIKLNEVIVNVLRHHPSLNYFQGYHDIISVLLLTLDDHNLTMKTAEALSLHRIRDSMATGLEPVLGYLKIVGRILAKADPELSATVGIAADLPYFSLSWVLTLMSHDLTSLSVLSRLFDFLFAYSPAMIAYFAVALILMKKEELSSLDDDDMDDPAIMHHTLSKVPHVVDSSARFSEQTSEEDEDLMSAPSYTPSYADSSHSRTRSPSFLSESTVSIPRSSSLSIDALDDSMLSDPDADVSLNTSFFPPLSPTTSSHSTSSSHSLRPTISIDELIATSLRLFETYPLLGETGIAADEIMGSQSCIFTWPLDLSNAEADEIARKGIDIVCPEPALSPTKEKVEEQVSAPSPIKVKEMRRRRKVEIGVGAALTIVGLAGVVLAIYGREMAEREEWGRVVEWGTRWWGEL